MEKKQKAKPWLCRLGFHKWETISWRRLRNLAVVVTLYRCSRCKDKREINNMADIG